MILRPCPFCQKKIPVKISVCPYCKRDDAGKDTSLSPLEALALKDSAKMALAGLGSTDRLVRLKSEEEVFKLGSGMIPELVKILETPNSPALLSAMKVLGVFREKRILPFVKDLLRSGTEEQKAVALLTLQKFTDPDVWEQIDPSSLQDPILESFYAYSWGSLQSDQGLDRLKVFARHRKAEVAFHAVYALGEMGSKNAVGLLRKKWASDGPFILSAKNAAVKKLGAVGVYTWQFFRWLKILMGVAVLSGIAYLWVKNF